MAARSSNGGPAMYPSLRVAAAWFACLGWAMTACVSEDGSGTARDASPASGAAPTPDAAQPAFDATSDDMLRAGDAGAGADIPVDATGPVTGASDSGSGGEPSGADETDASHVDAGDPSQDATAMQPIEPPVADECITDVSAGDHTFTCGGVTFLVRVDERCTQFACGLIFDVHGGTMAGAQMRDNTRLHELAPPEGYLVVHPSATSANTGGSWDLTAHPPVMGDFMDRMIAAFHVDSRRIHVTGFSQGSAVTFWFLCHKPELLASTAPVSGSSAADILAPDGSNCIESIAADWPRSPILFMNGTLDMALGVDDGRARVSSLARQLGLTDETSVAPDGVNYRRVRYTGEDGMLLDYIEHDYGGQAVLGGHCIPGGTDVPGSANNFILNATTCTEGDIQLDWGEEALRWFLDHPKR